MKLSHSLLVCYAVMASIAFALTPFSSSDAKHFGLNEYLGEVVFELKLARMELVEIKKILIAHHR